MAPYEEMIKEFERDFRTPEFHKGSRMRTQLLRGERADMNALLVPLNHATTFWHNTMTVVRRQADFVFGGLHEPIEAWISWIEATRQESGGSPNTYVRHFAPLTY